MITLYKILYGLQGGMTEEEAIDEFRRTGRVPVGWKRVGRRGFERTDLSNVLDIVQGENSLGRGPLAYLSPEEIGNFRLVNRRAVEFTSEFRAPLPERLDFRKYYEQFDLDMARENAERDFEDLLRWLKIHKYPAKIVFPYGMASNETIPQVIKVVGAYPAIPEIDLFGDGNTTFEREMDAFDYFKGVKRLNISDTNVGDNGLIMVADTLEELVSEYSQMTDDIFPALTKLKRLEIDTERSDVKNFSRLTNLQSLNLLGSNFPKEAFESIPLSVKKLFVLRKLLSDTHYLRNEHLARLNLTHLNMYNISDVTVLPNIPNVKVWKCTGLTKLSFLNKSFDELVFREMAFIPPCKFVKTLQFYNMDTLTREFDDEGNPTTEFPDCVNIIISFCEELSFQNLRPCKSLKTLSIKNTSTVGYRPRYFFEDLRNLCPQLTTLKMTYDALENAKGRPAEFGFDLEII